MSIIDPNKLLISLEPITQIDTSNVLYDSKKTTLTSNQLQTLVTDAINTYATNNLNTFNSTFSTPELITTIQATNPGIITNESSIRLQKKFYPVLNSKKTYQFDFGIELQRNYFNAGLSSSPDFSTTDTTATNTGLITTTNTNLTNLN